MKALNVFFLIKLTGLVVFGLQSMTAMAIFKSNPAVFKQIIIKSDRQYQGQVVIQVHKDRKDRQGVFKTIPLAGKTQIITPSSLGTSHISNVAIDLVKTKATNIGGGAELDSAYHAHSFLQTPTRSFKVRGQVKLKSSKKGKRFRVRKNSFTSSIFWDVKSDFNQYTELACDNLFKISEKKSGTLQIEVNGFDGIHSCDSLKNFAEFSPEFINTPGRDISAGINDYTIFDDQRLGDDFANNFDRSNSQFILSSTHPLHQYVEGLVKNITAVSDNYSWFVPKVRVINADVLNAFAVPGGHIYVFTGLIKAAKSESQLSGVLGHEIGHIISRHSTKGMTHLRKDLMKWIGLTELASMLTSITKTHIDDIIVQLAGTFKIYSSYYKYLGKGRSNELEADRLGMQYNFRMNMTPWGIGDMFQEFAKITQANGHSQPTIQTELGSTHPAHERRVLQAYFLSTFAFPEFQSQTLARTSSEFTKVKNILGALSPVAGEVSFGNSLNEQGKSLVLNKHVHKTASQSQKLAQAFAHFYAAPAHNLVTTELEALAKRIQQRQKAAEAKRKADAEDAKTKKSKV